MKNIYLNLKYNPPKLEVKENARELIIVLISCMCDNRYTWKLKKNAEGDFKLNTNGFAYSNFGVKFDKDELEWGADEGNWDEVFEMINSGSIAIQSIKSR